MDRSPHLILFGTQTGTAEDLADELYEDLHGFGISCELCNMFDVTVESMVGREKVFVIVSTWGDGDPPDDAEDFYEALWNLEVGALEGVQFAVFGLGDSSYEAFCECGKEMDRLLERAGGSRLLNRVDCDVEIDATYERWKVDVRALFEIPDSVLATVM